MRATIAIAAVLLAACAVQASVPRTMSYQGVLSDHGVPVPDDDYSMTFAIYSVESGGVALWTESRLVEVAGGIFNVTLGEVTPIDLGFDAPYWLEMSVEGEAPMSPRIELASAPYAHRAVVADSLSGGIPTDADWSMNGDIAYRTNDVGIGTATPMSKLTISSDSWDDHLTLSRLANDSGHISIGSNNMVLWTGGGSGLYVANSGNVGVGVASPSTKLAVNGTAQVAGFQMPTGASAGYVLTSDVSGVGTWQSASDGVGGSGTADYVPRFTGATTLGDSPIRVSGTMVGINTNPSATLHVNGTMDVEDETYFHSDVHATNLQSSGSLTLASGSADRIHLDSAGNVGIGTVSPGALLDVDGTAQVTGLRMPTGASDGHVLVSDASGNASWQAGAGLALPYSGTTDTDDGTALSVANTGDGGTGGSFHGEGCGLYASSTAGGTQYWHRGIHASISGGASLDDGIGVYVESQSEATTSTGLWCEVSGSGQVGTTHDYRALNATVNSSAEASGSNYGGWFSVVGNASYDNCGVKSTVSGVSGQNTYGLYAYTAGTVTNTSYGIYAAANGAPVNYAGYFAGDVFVSGTLSKSAGSFKIDHPIDPENMYLSHSFVESPDMMNVYNGNVILDGRGEAWVELPEYFEALNRDFRYQLTPVGGAAPDLHIAERISDGRFAIAGGEPGLEVSWQVTGIRRDKFAEEHPIIVEEAKRDVERGKYLNPELYGRPGSDGVHYAEHMDSDSK